jgi:hypothetical protein
MSTSPSSVSITFILTYFSVITHLQQHPQPLLKSQLWCSTPTSSHCPQEVVLLLNVAAETKFVLEDHITYCMSTLEEEKHQLRSADCDLEQYMKVVNAQGIDPMPYIKHMRHCLLPSMIQCCQKTCHCQ